jgi:uncharacterized membrane protein HdeD (DUF308 family)
MHETRGSYETMLIEFVTGSMMVLVGMVLLLSSGVDHKSRTFLRQLAVVWCLLTYAGLSFGLTSVISRFNIQSYYMKGVTYMSVLLSLLFFMMSLQDEEQYKFIWGLLSSVFSVVMLIPYWNALIRSGAFRGFRFST